MKRSLRIGELAKESGRPPETIRFYEREGLLPAPQRTGGNYRMYNLAHATRLAFIRNCRVLDMTLEEIRELLGVRDLAAENCSDAHRLIGQHMTHLAERISELKLLEKQLKSMRRSCSTRGQKGNCSILDDLGRTQLTTAARPRSHHVKGSHR